MWVSQSSEQRLDCTESIWTQSGGEWSSCRTNLRWTKPRLELNDSYYESQASWSEAGWRQSMSDSWWSGRNWRKNVDISWHCDRMTMSLHSNSWSAIATHTQTHTHNRFTALFPGPYGWAGARRELLDFMVQVEINHPAGHHSIRTNQCPRPPTPHIFYRPDALPAAQSTLWKHWRQLAHSD